MIKKTSGGWVPINKFAQFSTVRVQIQHLADNKAYHELNNFCVIGQKDGKFLAAYVYWKTENRLIMWFLSKNDSYNPLAVTYSNIWIDLNDGMLEEEDAKSDRDEMQRSYAEGILQACDRLGQNFTIVKSKG